MSAAHARPAALPALDEVDETTRPRVRALVKEHTLTTVATRLGVSRRALYSYLNDSARRGSVVLIEAQARALFGR